MRGTRGVLTEDLAQFYEKSVGAFNQAVSRNMELFEGDRFQLTYAETVESRAVATPLRRRKIF
ncbi:hypothetical protein RA27_21055 [Ruegeria sp. ANG-R]|uniref:ORF6N domain-containing protein n=1 Tax=Ruegeria sp. ANG-R TaxID=1577903 RepID=UPI00057DAC04|nr:ORF6N domain-containing protein [Ruegeria sp. ANG-R]KIC37644.1 hypothetical protein RA27_21055 [Ruegeria sp. ANG-R]